MNKIKKIGENVFMFIDEKIDILEETESGIVIPSRRMSITSEANDIDCNDEFLDVYEKDNYAVFVSNEDTGIEDLFIECSAEICSSAGTSYNVNMKTKNISIRTGCTLMDRDFHTYELDKDRSLFVVSILETQAYNKEDWAYFIDCVGIYNNSGKLYMIKYDDEFGTDYGISPSKDKIINVYSSNSLVVKATNPVYTAKFGYEIL